MAESTSLVGRNSGVRQKLLPKLKLITYSVVRIQHHGYRTYGLCVVGTPVCLMRALLVTNILKEVGEERYTIMTIPKGPVMKFYIPCFRGT